MSEKHYRQAIFNKLGYTPTPEEWAIHNSKARQKLVAGGWQAGKSITGAKEAVLLALRGAKLGWIVGPTYATPRGAEWDYIVQDLITLGALDEKNYSVNREGALTADLEGGCHLETKSATDPKTLGGQAPDFIIACEAAQLEYETYLWLRGRIAPKRAPLIMTGTFEDYSGWYNDFYNKWQIPNDEDGESFSLPSWSNRKLYPGGRTDPEILRLEAENPHDWFLQRYAGIPCKPSGIVLPEFSNIIHVSEELAHYTPDVPVEIAVDPGTGVPGAYAVLAIQVVEGIPRIIAEKYLQGYITEDIITSCEKDWKPWFSQISRGVIDIAGTQKHGMPAPVKQWQDQAKIFLESSYVLIEDGIKELRTFLKVHPETNRPNTYVNPSCKGFISECGGCKSPVHGGGPWLRNLDTGKASDYNCHATKAYAYWLVKRFGYRGKATKVDYKPIQTLHFPKQPVGVFK